MERGLLLTSDEVRSILDGAKRCLRRPFASQPKPGTNLIEWNTSEEAFVPWDWTSGVGYYAGGQRTGKPIVCPFGREGDRLWVKETWAVLTGNGVRTVYRADGEDPREGWVDKKGVRPRMKWRPSTQMGRARSRLTLRVTDVRADRIQAISEADARAEGFPKGVIPATINGVPGRMIDFTARGSFIRHWIARHGEPSWDRNDWVWAVHFEVWADPYPSRSHIVISS